MPIVYKKIIANNNQVTGLFVIHYMIYQQSTPTEVNSGYLTSHTIVHREFVTFKLKNKSCYMQLPKSRFAA